MGAEFTVRCTACEYQAEVTVGGGESGVHFETFICRKCSQLFSLRTRAAHKMTNVLLNKLMEHDAKAPAGGDAVKPRCPFCRAKEVEPCSQDVACPKCGGTMEWEKTSDFD